MIENALDKDFERTVAVVHICNGAQLYSCPVDTVHSCTCAQSIRYTIVLVLSRHGAQLHSCAIESCSAGAA